MISHASPDLSAPRATSSLQAVVHPGGYDYLVSLPTNYASVPPNGWPLMLFLHGAAQRGSDVWDVTQQGVPKLLLSNVDLTAAEAAAGTELMESFIVVAPQCPHYEVWDDGKLLALLDESARQFSIDTRRVYLTGLSMGGFGAWSLGIRHPERFASLVPVCGGGRVRDVITAAKNRPAVLQGLGVWAFHGARDIVVPLAESERMVEALINAGVHDVRLTIYPDAVHDSWSVAYADRELYAWMLQHAR